MRTDRQTLVQDWQIDSERLRLKKRREKTLLKFLLISIFVKIFQIILKFFYFLTEFLIFLLFFCFYFTICCIVVVPYQ